MQVAGSDAEMPLSVAHVRLTTCDLLLFAAASWSLSGTLCWAR